MQPASAQNSGRKCPDVVQYLAGGFNVMAELTAVDHCDFGRHVGEDLDLHQRCPDCVSITWFPGQPRVPTQKPSTMVVAMLTATTSSDC